ncbi:hypothetical protein [Larkinella soli]|uniref:hypothetical protein n=1 Tax=Larkinella soli TaxID=1770527 RepID=UPI000FFBF5D9|nr:hypothetical protein [Larkinella soli]
MRQELHILIGCADARDLSQLQLDVVNDKINEYRTKDIHVELQVIRAAGSFVTQDVFEDINHIIRENQKRNALKYDRIDHFVHIQTHGHLHDQSDKSYVSHIYKMGIVEGSALNCGMLGATGVAVEIEQMLVENQLEYDTPAGKFKIRNDEDIRHLLKEVYAHDGYLAGDWVQSIDYLRTHPRAQRARLQQMIDRDADLNRLGIRITAGILDYSIHALIRLDGGQPPVPWWDEVQAEIRRRASSMLDILTSQSQKQQPYAGLLCTPNQFMTSRALAARYYLNERGIDVGNRYLPNTIFNITSTSFDVPSTPFGPYVITGFYYAVKYLKLTDQLVMGYDEEQTRRMLRKIENDPIMRLIVRQFSVNLIPINQKELLGSEQQERPELNSQT